MRLTFLTRLCLLLLAFAQAAASQSAHNATIIRDDWGIAHIYGKTDADAVFGAEYAQAEDDFNRVETNYINAIGCLPETEGESKIWQDLREKLFMDPDVLKKQYAASPAWLKSLMSAFADGLNYYLAKHPDVKPRVIRHFEPWMALTFTEGSIGGDIEKVKLDQLQAFYGHEPLKQAELDTYDPEPSGSNGMAIAPSNTRVRSQAALQGISLDEAANQQGFNQALSQAGLYNQSVGQNFGQGATAAGLYNSASGQNFNEGLQAAQFQNQAAGQSLQQQLALRNQPLNEINALQSGSQIQNPQFQAYSGQNVAAAPVFQGVQQQAQYAQDLYGQQMAARNAQMAAIGQGLSPIAAFALGPH